ncbi:MAG: hypothetical protein NTZ15_01305 [Burkholderiales bacterium]|jgi:hypothetical protein|nr:hypothetical protein [Burkholderiales bacterium]
MYIVPIGWLYVALMMAVAEATNTNGTVLGAVFTFVLYGVVPVALVVYLMGAPARRRAIKAQAASELAAQRAQASSDASIAQPDTGSHSSTNGATPVGEKS